MSARSASSAIGSASALVGINSVMVTTMQKRRSSLVRLRGDTYYENFTVDGIRYRGSLKTDSEETAEIIASKRKSDIQLAKLVGKPPEKAEMTLDTALGAYWLEHAHLLPSAPQIKIASEALRVGLGKMTLLSEITPRMLTSYVAARRAGKFFHPATRRRRGPMLANATINNDLMFLRAVMNREEEKGGVNVAKIEWRKVFLEAENERQHILSRKEGDGTNVPVRDEERLLFQALRADFHGLTQFALLTGMRISNIINLTWNQVKWDQGQIAIRVKSKKPGGKLHYVPISTAVKELLLSEWGRHPQRVFTFICHKSNSRRKHKKGERYPVTYGGLRREWVRAIQKAGLWYGPNSRDNLRIHDLRHTAATRALKKCGNLKTVQKLLGHASLASTVRYAKTDIKDVLDAME